MLASCRWFHGESVIDRPAGETPVRPASRGSGALPLAHVGATFSLPPSNRPGGEPAPDAIPLGASFERVDERNRADIWGVPLPVLSNLLPSTSGGTHQFGSKEPLGFTVTGPDGPVRFERGAHLPGSYGVTEERLLIGLEKGSLPPDAAEYTVSFRRATDTENGMNLASSGLAPEAFARRTVTVGTRSWTGVYLPPPASATFAITVPERGRLSTHARILAPAIVPQTGSDGARVEVVVGAEVLAAIDVPPGEAGAPVEVDLAKYAGQEIELVLRTTAGADGSYDYLLLESPVVYTPSESPERVVLVFVDTLRPDHLHYAGYPRQTSPVLDRLVAHAASFDQARSVAPWTLPSARSALTGHQPEDWFTSRTLPEILGAAGWRTDAIVSNAFLSQPFDVHRGWDAFDYRHLAPAPELVDQAVARLEAHHDRDQLLMVHFMEPHLPWDEPLTYRRVWASRTPEALKTLTRSEIGSFGPGDEAYTEVRQHAIDRYDQEILAVDAALEALFDAAGPRATIVFFSDHGEELWDHGGFEHGHTFYDELLRVPLVIRSPYLPPGRFDAPVSLLDLAPTVCELAGLTCADGPGRSLVGLAWGDPGAAEALAERPQAFGRPLYGADGWGLVDHGKKWTTRGGAQTLFSLGADPQEKLDLAPGEAELAAWATRLGTTLGREVRPVWRVELPDTPWTASDLLLAVSHPSGIAAAWLAPDPRGTPTEQPKLLDGRAQLRIPIGEAAPPAVYLVPAGDVLEPGGLVVSLIGKGLHLLGTAPAGRVVPGARPPPILTVGETQFGVRVMLDATPEPSGGEVSGFHPDVADQLRDLGYVDPQ